MNKKILIVSGLAMIAMSCSGSTEEESNPENEVNKEEILEIENATNEVEEGLIHLEEDAHAITDEIDSLLNDI